MHWFIGHLVGDYIFQNDWQAQNKKKRDLPCLVRVLLYTLAIWIFTSWPLWALFVVAFTHAIQDRTTIIEKWMNIAGQKGFVEHMSPWSVIIVDNTFHLLTLFFLSLYCEAPRVAFLEWSNTWLVSLPSP